MHQATMPISCRAVSITAVSMNSDNVVEGASSNLRESIIFQSFYELCFHPTTLSVPQHINY